MKLDQGSSSLCFARSYVILALLQAAHIPEE